MLLNTAATFFNRILFHNYGKTTSWPDDVKHAAWHYPILLTFIHAVACLLIYTPFTFDNWGKAMFGSSFNFQSIPIKVYFYELVPTALLGCLTVVLNNASLNMLDVATLTFIKSTTPVFTALFSFIILQKVNKLH